MLRRYALVLGALLFSGASSLWACAPGKPLKMVLRGPVLPAAQLAKELKLGLPCRLESSALACMCRPLAKANFEVVVGFRWKTTQMSEISTNRMKELGDALRAIEGYSGATIKMVAVPAQDKPVRALSLQRRNGVGGLLALAPSPKGGELVSAALPVTTPAPANSRWVRQKFVISAVFV
jgi:hypothetical protein